MEFYSIFSHGALFDNKKLKPIHRKLDGNFIPIIMFGTQTYPTVHGITLFYYVIFTKNYGSLFLSELLDALIEYPVQYCKRYKVNDETNIYQKAVKFLFDINLIEMDIFPQNRFRLFLQEDPIRQPLDVFLSCNREMVVGKTNIIPELLDSSIYKKVSKLNDIFHTFPDNLVFSKKMTFQRKNIKLEFDKQNKVVGLLYPYGTYRTNSTSNLKLEDFHEKRLSKILKEVIEKTMKENNKKLIFKHPKFNIIKGVFIFCCKMELKKKVKNFEFPENKRQSISYDSLLLSKPTKLFFNPDTKKFEIKKEKDKEKFIQYQKKIEEKLKEIQEKRQKRKKKKNIF